MTERTITGKNILLRVFVGETDLYHHHSLYMEILERARKMGLAGCTVIRGIAGFGASSVIHTDHLFRLSHDLPMIVELVDSREHIEKFLADIEPLLEGALVTEENVHVVHYSRAKKK
jgi:hypothetical protein